MTEPLLILLAACCANNLLTERLLGVAPLVLAAERPRVARALPLAFIGLTTLTAFISSLLHGFIITPMQLENYRLLILVMAIAGICLLCSRLLARYWSRWHDKAAGVFPLLLLNCTLLGVALLAAQQQLNPLPALFFGAGSGLGLALVSWGFTAINQRLAAADLPACFRGLPIQLITLGLIALAFSGF